MIEIKFRAWDKTTKKWLKSVEFDISSEGKIKTYGIYHPCELMQYTGLKDRNGKEIWEGDIVEIPLRWGKTSPAKCEVLFENGAFMAYSLKEHDIQGKGLRWLILSLTDKEGVEIIGNIYEHSNLLTP